MSRKHALVATVISISIGVNVFLGLKVSELLHQQEVYNWRYFTCRTLLDDPVTRRIMDSKWRRTPFPDSKPATNSVNLRNIK